MKTQLKPRWVFFLACCLILFSCSPKKDKIAGHVYKNEDLDFLVKFPWKQVHFDTTIFEGNGFRAKFLQFTSIPPYSSSNIEIARIGISEPFQKDLNLLKIANQINEDHLNRIKSTTLLEKRYVEIGPLLGWEYLLDHNFGISFSKSRILTSSSNKIIVIQFTTPYRTNLNSARTNNFFNSFSLLKN